MQNLVVVSDTVRAHVGPKIWGKARDPPTGDGGVADPEKHAPTPHTIPNLVYLGRTGWA